MGLGEIEKAFLDKSLNGNIFPFFTIKEIAKSAKDSPSNVRTYVKTLISINAVRGHPFNSKMNAKRYQLNRDYFLKNYVLPTLHDQRMKEISEC